MAGPERPSPATGGQEATANRKDTHQLCPDNFRSIADGNNLLEEHTRRDAADAGSWAGKTPACRLQPTQA